MVFNSNIIKMKYLITSISLVFLLSSCFWWGDSANQSGLRLEARDWFKIQVPSSWQEIQSEDLPVPKQWSIELAFKSVSERQWYVNNIIVLSEVSENKKSSISLLKKSLISLKKEIQEFEILSQKEVTFTDESSGEIITYSGRYNSSTPRLVYVQTAMSCEWKDYFITLSLAESLESYDRYEYILETFSCQ